MNFQGQKCDDSKMFIILKLLQEYSFKNTKVTIGLFNLKHMLTEPTQAYL